MIRFRQSALRTDFEGVKRMKKPEVVYVRSGYLPLRDERKPVPSQDVFSSRTHAMIAELHKIAQDFDRLCAAVSIRIEEEKLRLLVPPVEVETKANDDLEDKEQSERVKLLKKILRLERRGNKLDKEILSFGSKV
jgi:hypothetical protein